VGGDPLTATPDPPRIRENQLARCDGCGDVTNTVRGVCPDCGYVKDDTWLPPPRRRQYIPVGLDDRIVIALAFGVIGVAAKAIVSGLPFTTR
jgi:ribosomal protein L37E